MTIGNLLLVAVLAGSPQVEDLRRELDTVAERIEQLKARGLAGESVDGELQPLLVRSQELAEQLEQALPEPAAPPAQPADEARERADELRAEAGALRGQARRLAAAVTTLDGHIAAALRAATSPPDPATAPAGVPQARLASAATRSDGGGPGPNAGTALRALVEQRARLEAHIGALRAEAARLEAQANALDGE